jgi:hypothetical protein
MAKNLGFTAAGLLCGVAGIALLYLFLRSINNGANIIFLLLFPVFFTASVFCIFMATKPKKTNSNIAISGPLDFDNIMGKEETKNSTPTKSQN